MVLPVRLCLERANDCSKLHSPTRLISVQSERSWGDFVYRSSPVESLRCSDSTIKAGFALYGQSRLAPLSCGRVLSGL